MTKKAKEHEWYPGFVRATPFDHVGRRALWIKFDPKTMTVELRSGREGDDSHVTLTAGQTIDAVLVRDLVNAIERVRWDCGGDDGAAPWDF